MLKLKVRCSFNTNMFDISKYNCIFVMQTNGNSNTNTLKLKDMKTFKIWSSDFLNTPLSQIVIIADTEREARIKVRSLGRFVDGDEFTNIKTIRETLESCGSSVYSGTISSNCSVCYNRSTKQYEVWGGNSIACSGSYGDVMQDLNNAIQQSIVSELD